MTGRSAAAKATKAADALLAWLKDQPSSSTSRAGLSGGAGDGGADRGIAPVGNWPAAEEAGHPENGATSSVPAALSDAGVEAKPALPNGMSGEQAGPAPGAPVRDGPEPAAGQGLATDEVAACPAFRAGRGDAEHDAPSLRPLHTDWLHHRLAVSGPAEDLAAFRAAAIGSGTIPWQLDLDLLEEDWFHLLASPPAPQRRSVSLQGARVLAGQLRDAVARRHDVAVTRVGHSSACPFDLHALVPVPESVLRLGPDHPDALAWLWEHWGTTEALRHVAETTAPASRQSAPGDAALHLSFWSADWTPWRALATVAARWPPLRFDIRPSYGEP